jgi:hypothetical protein
VTSTLGGSDPYYGLPPERIDREERKLREQARKLLSSADKRERQRKLDRANEISRRKSKRSHQ